MSYSVNEYSNVLQLHIPVFYKQKLPIVARRVAGDSTISKIMNLRLFHTHGIVENWEVEDLGELLAFITFVSCLYC